MAEPLVYLNGATVPASQAQLPIADAAIVQGATITEQTRTFHRKAYRLEAHLERFFQSLHLARLDPGLSWEQFQAISEEVVACNAALLDEGETASVISVPDDVRGERLIAFYTDADLPPAALWEKLTATGIPKLWIPKREDLRLVETIPTLGSGKVDLRALRQIAVGRSTT